MGTYPARGSLPLEIFLSLMSQSVAASDQIVHNASSLERNVSLPSLPPLLFTSRNQRKVPRWDDANPPSCLQKRMRIRKNFL